MNICVYGAASDDIAPIFLQQGEELGRLMAAGGHTLVFGGGAHGMMGAVARGVHAGGGRIIGIAPTFFDVPGILFEGCTQLILTPDMRTRKQKMEEASDAFIMAAGGVGTFEEFFEIFTLRALGRHNKPIAALNTDGYYNAMYTLLRQCADGGFMRPENLALCAFCATPDETLAYLASPAARADAQAPSLG